MFILTIEDDLMKMQRTRRRLDGGGNGTLALSAVLGIALVVGAAAAEQFELRRSTLDNGGGLSTGGGFQLAGTIGQVDAGVLVGNGFQLGGGFWYEFPPGDCDGDNMTGLSDLAILHDCLAGPGMALGYSCACFDLDADDDVDLKDFAALQADFGRLH